MKILSRVLILLAACNFSSPSLAAKGVRYVDLGSTSTCVHTALTKCGEDWADAYDTVVEAVNDLTGADILSDGDNDGGVIYVAAGEYPISSSLLFVGKPIQLIGAGMIVTELVYNSSNDPAVIIGSGSSGSSLSRLSIKPGSSYKASVNNGGVYIDGAADVTLSEILIINFGNYGNNLSHPSPFADPDALIGNDPSFGVRIQGPTSSATVRNVQITQCNNGIVALGGAVISIQETIVRDNETGPSLYSYDSPVYVSNSWFAFKADGNISYPESQYVIYLDGTSASTHTASQFINSETELNSGEEAHHIYVGTSGNQFINHIFAGSALEGLCDGADVDPDDDPYAINFADDTSDNVVGQYVSTGKGSGDPCMYDLGDDNHIWSGY